MTHRAGEAQQGSEQREAKRREREALVERHEPLRLAHSTSATFATVRSPRISFCTWTAPAR